MGTKTFGLDIGATTIKAVWFSKQNDAFSLVAASVMPTPSKGMLSESPLDQEEMAHAIKNIVAEAKIGTSYVNVALPENQVYTRVLEMPVLSDKELSSAIYWEAEQYIPVPLSNIVLDWKVLSRPLPSETDKKMQVFLVGAPTMLINKYQKILEMSGLIPSSVETEILSAIRALVFSGEKKQDDKKKEEKSSFPNSLIMNIGAVNTSLAIVRNGIIIFTYSIQTGGSAINRAIASDFGFTTVQAEEYKKIYGYSSKDFGGKIGKASKPILESIMTEIKKAIAFYSEKYKGDTPITQILLCGGTARLPGLGLFFAENCGIETAVANPWRTLKNQQLPKELLDNASDYTIAAGLAMKNYE
ncbi:MAG: type IV pilus assembly protein PilM [Candidatus Levybacteria bacterium]|nr:type IV pilus assembly protein PilM [Candidatus Levybacteria bacterium]